MIELIKRNILPVVIGISAISVSASAAFYSVTGLSKLFAGASLAVMIMASSLEAAKLVTATVLHIYWNTLNKILRVYLVLATVLLVIITSMGIYGFLSAAYQETFKALAIQQNKIEFLQNKSSFYEKDLIRYDNELSTILDNITALSQAKATSIQVKDKLEDGTTRLRNTVSTAELRLAQQRLSVEEASKKDIQLKRQTVADSVQAIKLRILKIQNDGSGTSELGPLQYIAGLTGVPMDKVINWLLIVLIIVFDPLAIALVLAANFAFSKANQKTIYGEFEKNTENTSIYSDTDGTLDKLQKNISTTLEEILKKNEAEPDKTATSLPITTPPKRKRGRPKGSKNKPKKESDWEVVYDEDSEQEEVEKILMKGPSKHRVRYKNGKEGFLDKNDSRIKKLY